MFKNTFKYLLIIVLLISFCNFTYSTPIIGNKGYYGIVNRPRKPPHPQPPSANSPPQPPPPPPPRDPNRPRPPFDNVTIVRIPGDWGNTPFYQYQIQLDNLDCAPDLDNKDNILDCFMPLNTTLENRNYNLTVQYGDDIIINQTIYMERKIPYITNIIKKNRNNSNNHRDWKNDYNNDNNNNRRNEIIIYGNFTNVNRENVTLKTCFWNSVDFTSINDTVIMVTIQANDRDTFSCGIAVDDSFTYNTDYLIRRPIPPDGGRGRYERSKSDRIILIMSITFASFFAVILLIVVVLIFFLRYHIRDKERQRRELRLLTLKQMEKENTGAISIDEN